MREAANINGRSVAPITYVPASPRGALRNVRDTFSAMPARCQKPANSAFPCDEERSVPRGQSCRVHTRRTAKHPDTRWCMGKQRGRTDTHHNPWSINKVRSRFQALSYLDNFSPFSVVVPADTRSRVFVWANCSNTALLLSTDSKILLLSQCHSFPFDS